MIQFLMYLALSFVTLSISLAVYKLITPYDELSLIRQGNLAATLAFSGTALGMTFPYASLVIHAVNVADFLIWAVVALAVQLVVYFLLSRVLHLKELIPQNHIAAGTMLGVLSVCAGILNAACLVY